MPITSVSNPSVGTSPAAAADPWTQIAGLGIDRLRAVLERTDQADVPLRHFLVLIIEHTGSRAQAFSAVDGTVPPPPHLIGAFRNGLGEGRLRRDLALYFAEEVADCFGRLFAWKAAKAATEEERRRLQDLAEAQHRLLDGIRKIVLPPSDCPNGDSTPDRR